MRKHLGLAAVAAALCLAAPGTGRAGQITFDEPYVAGVPNPASSTIFGPILTEYYAPMGVHFWGPNFGSGGVIVNDPGDVLNFGVLPHSGSNVLAFNGSATWSPFWAPWLSFGPTGPETIAFDNAQSQVSIWAAGGLLPHTFEMQAYDGLGNLLSTDTLTTQGWSELSVAGSDISWVVLTELGHPWDSYVYDDLSFTGAAQINGGPAGAPEPASLTLLGLGGVGGLGLVGWRRRRAKAARPSGAL